MSLSTVLPTFPRLSWLAAATLWLLSMDFAWAGPDNRGVAETGRAVRNEVLAPEMNQVDVDEHLGAMVDKNLTFQDHRGEVVRLGDYLDGETPVLLTLNYYRCPMLCNVQLNELTKTLAQLDWTPGDGKFRVVTVSIDPNEGKKLAAGKRESHLTSLDRGPDADWSFNTGDALNIRLLAAQLGFKYVYDAEQEQYAHPPVLMFLSPEGKIVRYIYGLTYNPGDIKFALMEAADGKVGSTVEKFILSCFHYDASAGKYSPAVFGIMRLGALLMIFLVGFPLYFIWRRERRKGRSTAPMEARS